MVRVPVDGVGKPEPLLASEYSRSPGAWSPRGDVLAFFEQRDGRQRLLVGGLDGSEPVQVGQAAFSVSDPEFSPDGRWLAYASDDSGANEVYVQPHPGPGARVRISTDGGVAPVWSRSGRELFYARGWRAFQTLPTLQMMVVDVDSIDGFRAGSPRQLFEGPYAVTTPTRSHDVTADGKRFVMIRPAGDREPPFTQMRVVFNWVEELKRLTAR
jgi:Tol biopolymer transport system component